MKRRTALWILLALAGLVLTAGLTAAASRLSNQHVGLSSEPLSAGDRLAPADVRSEPASRAPSRRAPTRNQTPPPTATSPSRSSPTPAPPVPKSGDDKVAGGDDSGRRVSGLGDRDDD